MPKFLHRGVCDFRFERDAVQLAAPITPVNQMSDSPITICERGRPMSNDCVAATSFNRRHACQTWIR